MDKKILGSKENNEKIDSGVDSTWLNHKNDLSETHKHAYSVGSRFWQGHFQKFFINIKCYIIKNKSLKELP